MRWLTVRVTASRARDEMVALLISEGAAGVQEEGESLVTSFPEHEMPSDLERRLLAIDAGATVVIAPMHEVSYDLHGTVTARQVGELFVVPPWETAGYPSDKTIVIEPGGAFGTGDHATTRGVLHLLQTVIAEGDVVADLGAGSAVLAIAAAKLGASTVAAVELDHDAILNAEENVAANDAADTVTIIEGDAATILSLLAPVDLVLANIVSGVLLGMLNTIRDSLSPGGHAILSGILVAERSEMLAAFDAGDWIVTGEHAEEEWWTVLLRAQ
ncbi:MAG: 50S ribosomal protein L11 methyltransferase [Gemmatimonadota bacterium]|nr:50S ribosomal protein L11 methyltransferase [Gemmatimonadota bacterium]